MWLLRIAGTALPQLLALLLAGAYFDLLGGWNHSDSAFVSLVILFLLAPLSTLALLIAEGARAFRSYRQKHRRRTARSIVLATVLLVEALALDLLVISQARMSSQSGLARGLAWLRQAGLLRIKLDDHLFIRRNADFVTLRQAAEFD